MSLNNKAKNKLKSLRDRALAGTTEKIINIESKLDNLISMNIGYAHNVEEKRIETILPISEREIVTKLFNGLKIYLDPVDIGVVPHMALDGIWEESITYAWNKVLEGKTIVFDVGANFGYFGLLAAHKLNSDKGSKVVLFEANPYLIPYIHKTLSVNWLNEHAIIENLSIADKSGTAKLTILKDYISCSSLQNLEDLNKYLNHKKDVIAQETITVKTISIDEYCSQNKISEVGLVKLDIEGYEQKAYKGMTRTVKENLDLTLFIEFTKDAYDNPQNFYESMLKDFSYLYMIDNAGALVLTANKSYEEVIMNAPDWIMLVFSKQKL